MVFTARQARVTTSHRWKVLGLALCSAVASAQSRAATAIQPGTSMESALGPAEAHVYSFVLQRGDHALIAVRQIGVDVIVDVLGPGEKLIEALDSPNGRSGDEIVELEAARSGSHFVRVRPFSDQEPQGRYELRFVSSQSASRAAKTLAEARQWLFHSSAPLALSGHVFSASDLRPIRNWSDIRVLGLGEATHGSREFGDLRTSLTQRLIEEDGYRVVAIEGSVSRFESLVPYISGEAPKSPDVIRRIEVGWIGRRSQRDLIEWVRSWNARHPHDRVRIVGVDAQDNAEPREILDRFIRKSDWDESVVEKWSEAAAELQAADEQTAVFGDSGVNPATRQFLVELCTMLDLDAPLLAARFGSAYQSAKRAAATLLEFADFNSNGEGGVISHSRAWYMAGRVLRSLQDAGPSAKVVYWAHNAHVAHPAGSKATAGGVLRQILGCGYRAIALTFGKGSFVAQIPNDLEDKLTVSTLPVARADSIETLLGSGDRPDAHLSTWACPISESPIPEWLRYPRRMHWVGGLYRPGSNPAEAYRRFALAEDFDGIAYFPVVTAEEVPTDRPQVPPRRRPGDEPGDR